MASDSISMSFDVETSDGDIYLTFIEKLRAELKSTSSHERPVLMRPSQSTKWLDLLLRAGPQTIILKIDRSDLYIVGYVSGDTKVAWEFNVKDTSGNLLKRRISHSKPLEYSNSGSYVYLTKAAGEKDRICVPLGRAPLMNAICGLAEMLNPQEVQKRSARCVFVLTQMISEAARFQDIAKHIAGKYLSTKEDCKITSEMETLENGWGTLSRSLFEADEAELSELRPRGLFEKLKIFTVSDAKATLGILKYPVCRLSLLQQYVCSEMAAASHGSAAGTLVSIDSAISHSLSQLERTLVSIDCVPVNSIDSENNDVTVKACTDDHSVYYRRREDFESNYPGEYILLEGPSDLISGVNLLHYLDGEEHLVSDDEIILFGIRDTTRLTTNLGKWRCQQNTAAALL